MAYLIGGYHTRYLCTKRRFKLAGQRRITLRVPERLAGFDELDRNFGQYTL
jgi:hypothetical protein